MPKDSSGGGRAGRSGGGGGGTTTGADIAAGFSQVGLSNTINATTINYGSLTSSYDITSTKGFNYDIRNGQMTLIGADGRTGVIPLQGATFRQSGFIDSTSAQALRASGARSTVSVSRQGEQLRFTESTGRSTFNTNINIRPQIRAGEVITRGTPRSTRIQREAEQRVRARNG